jgi:hypothetical protein
MAIDLPAGPPVPDEYVGVWKRTLLRTPTVEDTDSQVYWLQTRSWHADIRVPAGRPRCAGKVGCDELTRNQLFGLARQQGFCGTTLVEGNICRWLRRHDFQPASGRNDIGRMEFRGANQLLEYGVEANYFEIWERLPGSTGRSFAVQAEHDPLTFQFGAGDIRMLVQPRAADLPSADSLSTLAADAHNETLAGWLQFEISFGRVTAPGFWQVELSTLPWHEGRDVAEAA